MRRLDEIRRDADAALAPAPAEYLAMPDEWNTFIGPCPHGRDPFTRCDEDDDPRNGGCSRLSFGEALWQSQLVERRYELAADVPALVALVERLRDALNTATTVLNGLPSAGGDAIQCAISEARAALAAADGTDDARDTKERP